MFILSHFLRGENRHRKGGLMTKQNRQSKRKVLFFSCGDRPEDLSQTDLRKFIDEINGQEYDTRVLWINEIYSLFMHGLIEDTLAVILYKADDAITLWTWLFLYTQRGNIPLIILDPHPSPDRHVLEKRDELIELAKAQNVHILMGLLSSAGVKEILGKI